MLGDFVNCRASAMAGIAMLIGVAVHPAAAAPLLVIDSVIGTWTAATTEVDYKLTLATYPTGQLTGLGTSQITWGTWGTAGTPAGPSGYGFAANAPVTSPANNLFTLGTFTHTNNPIMDPSLTKATLDVTINGKVGSDLFSTTLQFLFTHNETVNTGPGCCDDIVTVNSTKTQTFTINSVTYMVFGYLAQIDSTTPVTDFLTRENAVTPAWLLARFSSDPPSINIETPIPAALPLFATGLGLLGFAGWRRRRKAAA